MKKNLTLKSKLILSFAILISIPLSVSCYVTYKMSSAVTERNAEELIAEKLDDKANKMNELIKGIDQLSMSISSSDEIQTLLTTENNEENFSQFNSFILGIRINQSNVNNIRVYDERQNDSYKNNSWYKDVLNKNGVGMWSSSKNNLFFRRAIISLEHPGEILGILEIDISSNKITTILENLKKEDYTQTSYLIKGDYDIFNPEKKFNNELIEHINKEHNGHFILKTGDNDVLINFKKIDKSDWTLVSFTSKNDVLKELYSVQNKIFFYIIFTIIFSIVIAYLISVQLVKPVMQLIDNTKKINDGDLTITNMEYKKDEIGELSSRFQLMATSLAQYIRNIFDSSKITKDVFRKVSDNSYDVANVFALISDKTDDIAKQTSEQSEEIKNGLYTIKDLSTNINDVVNKINHANSSVKETNLLSEKGNVIIDKLTNETLSEMKTFDRVINHIQDLDNVANSISNITLFIQDISHKIEILALNASIEANRSGKNSGFVVISNEIKKLSDLTKVSLEQILTIIDEANLKINQASVESNLFKDIQSKKQLLINETKLSFENISSSVINIEENLYELLHYSGEMDQNKDMLVDLISYISYVSKQTTENCIKVNEEIKKQEPSLLDLVSTVQKAEREIAGLSKQVNVFKF